MSLEEALLSYLSCFSQTAACDVRQEDPYICGAKIGGSQLLPSLSFHLNGALHKLPGQACTSSEPFWIDQSEWTSFQHMHNRMVQLPTSVRTGPRTRRTPVTAEVFVFSSNILQPGKSSHQIVAFPRERPFRHDQSCTSIG